MKKVFLNVWKKALVLSLAVIPFVITACGEDSGLGSTVDTEAPKIEITYPPLGANIRGTFVLAGNCDDDKSVKSIIVTVTDTTTKKVVGTVPASIENEGKSWKASINNYNDKDKKYDYLDGNYQFTAEVHDGAGHKSNASRVFDLDNTAPVFVASNPGVIKSQGKKASAYGSIFTIDGTIADDHTIASLTAKIFDENGTLIGDYKEEDIATAGGTSVTIASHYVDKNDGTARTVQNERYTQIYGDNDAAGTKKYYCTVLVEDNTKSYTNPGESDNTTSGNITSKVYLYDSVYKSLMSSKSGNRYGLSAADFMTLLNGTRAADEKTEPALKILKEVVVDTSAEAEDKDANKLSFSLNPMANPTYSVNGFAVSKDAAGNDTYKEAFSDSTVVVSVNAGLDKTAILPGNLKVWTVLVDGLTPEKALERVSKVASKITAVQKLHYEEVLEKSEEIIKEIDTYAEAEKLDIVLVKDNSTDSGSSVQTETLSCVLPKEAYISGKVYAFIVTGYDEDDVAFLQNTLYAFKANEAGIAPTLIITEPANQSYIKTTEGLVFKGRTYLPDGSTLKVAALTINLRVQDENKQNIAVGKTDGYTVDLTYNETSGYSSTDESLTYDTSTKVWTFTPSKLADYNDISASEGEGKSYFYTVDISSESSSRNATSKTISVHVDSTMPKVSIANVTPYVSGSNFYSEAGENIRNYVNGDITVKFNIEETNLKEVSYKVLVDGEEKVAPVSLGKVYSGSIDLDTTKWTETAKEKKNIEVVITAVDVCGNTTSYSTTEYNTVTYKNSEGNEESFNKPIVICQETDIPQIKFANAELSYKTGKDDQIVEHSFLVVEEEAKNDANKKSIVASHNLFNIKNNNTIQIALDDDDNIASAKVVLYDEAGKLYEADGFENPSIKQIGKPSFTWNYLLPAKEGIYQVYIEVTDSKLKDDLSETVKLWRTNKVGKFYVAVDDGAPTVEIKNPVAGSYQKKAFAANGTVSEKDNVTLTRSIYKLDAKAEDKKSVDITAKITKDKDGNFIWAETDEDIKDLADGEYILSYTATDRYEQSYTSDVRVKVDTKAPVFKDDKSKVFVSSNAEAGKAYVEKTWFNSEALNLSGEFEEANGISNVYYWLDTDVNTVEKDGKTQIVFSDILNEDKTVKTKGASGSFTAVTENGISTYKTTIPDFTECSAANAHKLTLIAVDLAGNESEKIEYTSIKVDMTAPTFENYYYKMGAVKGEVSGNILTNGENNVTLYGLISDAASGVDVNNFVLNVINGTTKSILADTQTVNNITFTTEPTSWTEVDGENQQTVNVDTTAGFEKWIEKADAATATTFKDGASIEDTTKITGWKAEIPNTKFTTGEVRADYYDKAGNSSLNIKMFSVRVDDEKPKLSNHTLTAEKKDGEIIGFKAYKAADYTFPADSDTKIPHYYVNNSDGHTFSLSGVATDNEGVAKVELVGAEGKTADKGEFSWTGITLPTLDSDGNITVKITDIANNVFEQKIHITIDTLAPSGVHDTESDSKGKDTIFRVGDADNILDEINSTSCSNRSSVAALTAQDKDVGGKYYKGTYGKSNSIKIRGQFEETGSGLKEIYYKIFKNTPPSATEIENFKKDYENEKSGVFAPLSSKLDDPANDKRLVKVNTADNAWRYDEIQSNYKMAIAGFGEGKNYLVVAAVDNVGNIALDNVIFTYTPENSSTAVSLNGCYSINVDTVTPELVENSVTATIDGKSKTPSGILTNFADGDLTIAGTALDEDSGVESVVLSVKVGTENHTVKVDKAALTDVTGEPTQKKWTADIDDVWFTDIESGNFTVYASITDKAGMEKTLSVATIIVDTKLKEVKLEKPADADTSTDASGIQINGIINLKGTIDDENVLPATAIKAIEYKENTDAATWTSLTADSHTAMPNLALSGNYTFYATSFDTRALTDGNEYYIRARGVDSANNEGLSDSVEANKVLVKVDQDTDRPVIKITTLDSNVDPTTSLDVLQGTVSDDDGVSKFEWIDSEQSDSTKPGHDWTEITLNSGSWRIEDLASGTHQIKFRVTDSAETVFETGKASFDDENNEQHFTTTGYPYVVYGKNTLNRTTDLNAKDISFAVDLNPPVIESLAVASTVNTTEPAATAYEASKTKSFGANARYMWLKVLAKEDVALNLIADVAKDVTLKVGSEPITLTSDASSTLNKVTRTGDDYGFDDEEAGITHTGFTYIIGPIDTSKIKTEGTLTVALVINDKAKRASNAKTANIYIDMTAPEVTVTSPNVSDGKSSDSIIGTTVLRGEIRDTSNSSTIAKFFYMIPTQAQIGTSGIFKDLDANGKGYKFNSEHGWKDLKEIETSKAGVVNDYRDHTSMLWEIPVTSSKFKDLVTADGLSLIYYATAKTGTGDTATLTYAEEPETAIPSSVSNGSDGKNCVYVPLYFYTEDETGMSKVTATKILVDPYAGIPQVEIKTPENFAKTGGNLNFQGTASDDAGDLDRVVMTKLEVSTVEATKDDFKGANPKDDREFDWKEISFDILNEPDVVTKAHKDANGTIDGLKKDDKGKPYIVADGTASWKISINLSEISDASLKTLFETTNVPEIKIARATFVAYDTNGTASTFKVTTLKDEEAPLVTNIFVDKNAPKMSNIQLVQYASEPTASTLATAVPTISRSYSAGMYISHNTGNGEWYLKATVTDDASVEGIKIYSSSAYLALSGDTSKSQNIIATGIGTKTCTFIIPVSTDLTGAGKKTQYYPTIELDDGQHTDVTQNLSFFVDNTAPGMYLTTSATSNTAISDENKEYLRLKNNSNLVVNTDNVVENSDGSYTFGDEINEAGSGLAYVAFYFKKGNIYFSSVPKFGTTTVIAANGLEIDGTTITTNAEHLPVLSVTGLTRPAETQITYSIPAAYTDYIRTESLVKIGGSYHLISSVSGSTITLEDEVDISFTEAEFVFAQVVNHQVTEGLTAIATDTPNGVSNDDGDGLAEMVKQSGSSYKWSATILSDLIKDGPCEIHVVAFDEAGNVNSGYVKTSVQNNRPRISKVFLGTDLNGNGKFDYYSESGEGAVAANNELYPGYTGNGTEFGELSFYSALSSDGKIQGNVTLKSSNFVAKDKLLVLPEIIGGNTPTGTTLKYLYKVADTPEAATITRDGDTGAGILTELDSSVAGLKLAQKGSEVAPTSVADLLGANLKADKWNYYQTTQTDYKGNEGDMTHGGTADGKYQGLVLETGETDSEGLRQYESWTSTAGVETKTVKYFAFTIWDATEGTTQGTDSLYALLKIPMVVNVVDDIAPKAVIHPFYWNSKEDGSFCYDEDGVALGHIDIDDGTGTKNPGVSGQVWINATVEDETRLSSAKFKDPGDIEKVVANYTNGNWEVVETGLPAHWKKVEILDSPEPNQAGHKMSFRVAIDMTQYGLGNNRTVNAGAVDKSNTESDPEDEQTIDPKAIAGTTHTGKLTSHYIMNFVPYIKSIYPATESSASRSRLGKFPVQAGKPMIIEGMNFAAGAEYCVSFYKSKLDVNGSMVQDDSESATTDVYTGITSDTDGQIKINAPNYSRWVKVWIKTADGWIGTMNNENVDYGCNIEEGYVPSDDNGKGNRDRGLKRANDAGTNFWTDDRYIAVWNVDTRFPGSSTPISGVVKKLDEKNTGSKVPANDVAGGGYIYKQKGYSGTIESLPDQNDHYYGVMSSYDLKVYGYLSKKGDNYYKSLGTGDNVNSNDSETTFVAPADELDYTVVNGLPYYVMQDNALCGESANRWGSGLFLSRDGYQHDRKYSSAYQADLTEKEEFYIIERLGASGTTAASRNSSTGYDNVLHQFKNPRIVGWNNPNEQLKYTDENGGGYAQTTDYIYVSYYDSYAKCLKYAAYKVGHRFDGDKIATVAGQHWGSHNQRSDCVPLMHTAINQAETKNNNVPASDNQKTGNAVVAGWDTLITGQSTFKEKAGEWSDIMLDTSGSSPIPVIIYYNETNKCLEVAVGKTSVPSSGNIANYTNPETKTGITYSADKTKNAWTKTTGIRPNNKVDFGRYVSAVMDKNYNIHAAAQDVTNGKLYYIFLSKADGYKADKAIYKVVDASGTSGMWTDIELTNDNESNTKWYQYQPVISHMDKGKLNTTKAVKAAYVVTETTNGVTNAYWESMTDPAIYSANDQRTSVMCDVYEQGETSYKAPVAVGFNSDMLALDFLRAEE